MSEPFQTLFEKLMLMGWVEDTASRDVAGDTKHVAVRFTPLGKSKINSLKHGELIAEITRSQGPLTPDEISVSRGLPMLVAQQN